MAALFALSLQAIFKRIDNFVLDHTVSEEFYLMNINAIKKYPLHFEGLILCDTQCGIDASEVKEKRLLAIEKMKQNGVEKFTDDLIQNLFATESFTNKKKEIESIREVMLSTNPTSVCNTLLALSGRTDNCVSLNIIKVPVLIIVGKEDKITPPAVSEFLHQNIKGSSLVVLEKAGHVSNVEQADEFNHHLKSFLSLFEE